jgi:hypothetical protein
MKKFLLIGLLALTACSAIRPAYVKPGTTWQQATRDYQACWDETTQISTARTAAGLFFLPLAMVNVEHDKPARERCMQARGYHVGPGSGYR